MFIPILIALAAFGLGHAGVSRFQQGRRDLRQAQQIVRQAEADERQDLDRINEARADCDKQLHRYAALQSRLVDGVLTDLMRLLERLRQRGALEGIPTAAELILSIKELQRQSREHLAKPEAARSMLRAGAMSYAAGWTTLASATAVGVSSTGAAISSLSGAAAHNATMAWLGGGSLAAGGGGMALGTWVLGGAMVAPAAFAGGTWMARQGARALTDATEFAARVNVEAARRRLLLTQMDAAGRRVEELEHAALHLEPRLRTAMAKLRPDEFSPENPAHIAAFQATLALAKTLAEVLRAPIVESPAPGLTLHYRRLLGTENP